MELPTQPKPEDYTFNDRFQENAFQLAMAAWEKVCTKVAEQSKCNCECDACSGDY